MIPGLSAAVLLVDVVVVAWTAWMGACAAGLGRRGLVEGLLAWLLLALAWVAGSGVLLGMFGGLGPTGFLAIHAVGLAGALFARRSWRDDLRQGREWLADWWRLGRGGTAEGSIAAGLAVVLLALGALAALAEPVTYDALTYRLSRIGAWLQDGWIRHFSTDDPRLNYMPVAPDVVIAWLLGGAKAGFALAPWPQLAGGILLIGATFGLARTLGLSRLHALGAVGVLLGMANVSVQLTTIQSDLFTAGIFAASYLLWHRAWQRGEGSWVAGIGGALAFGSKGTMLYLWPGAAIWVGWLVWQRRGQGWALWSTAAALIAAALVFVAPGWWHNVEGYGSWAGPREAVVLHHGEFSSPAHYPEKMFVNLGTSAVQLFEPTAQPWWLQDASSAAGEKLARRLSAEPDPYVFIGQSRREQVARVMALTEPDADVVTCGLLAVALFAGGLLRAAARPGHSGAKQVLVWGGGVVVYLVTQHALVQWHHWAFRFMVLAAPWMAVVGAWVLAALPAKLRIAAWAVVIGSAVQVFAAVQWQASQAAWRATTQPERSAGYFHFRHWRTWAAQLDRPAEPLTLALPIDRALAAFHRLDPPRRVTIEAFSALRAETAEAALGDASGWLLVPDIHFQGREGRVMGRTGPLGIAAFRRLLADESPRPMLYANQLSSREGTMQRRLLVRTWADAPVQLELFNPAATAVRFDLKTPTGTIADTLAAGARGTWTIPVPPDVLAVVTIDFPRGEDADPTTTAIMVRLAP